MLGFRDPAATSFPAAMLSAGLATDIDFWIRFCSIIPALKMSRAITGPSTSHRRRRVFGTKNLDSLDSDRVSAAFEKCAPDLLTCLRIALRSRRSASRSLGISKSGCSGSHSD